MKYKLTAETKIWLGHKLHRIEAIEDFADVRAGDLGGWIESEENLSQEGNAMVFGNARVYGDARVRDNAQVSDNAMVSDNAKVYGDARVCDNAQVFGDARVCDNAQVSGDARVSDNARVYDNARVFGDAWVCGNAKVYGDARVCDNAQVSGDARVFGDAWVCGNAKVTFWHREDFKLGSTDHTVFKNSWSSYRDFFYNADTHLWSVGCFLGTSEELCRKAYADSEESGDRYSEYIKFVEMFRGGDHVDIEAIKKEVLENEANEDT